ncbi:MULTISPECIES: FmdB family zinc ribbon protein [unclassified Leifsonia]|uniref:FmdB family zinc ribbon protein n=1 Tax=unclassified Leifsonia TaxID=2663824 RepID=UPI000701A39D|nr:MULTISPECIES: FmdB family zinc ribbon protein [unclassified Leifsonia]KQX07565.1 FmdB family transcriptional regulator [Leifsonia sp. Root1293]KRA11847.1 FmdB family transcriptional regulator [Leifsonia sp. Root60]
MPTYSYRCTECDNAFDIQQSFTDDSLSICEVCGGRLRKVFNTIGVTFNGSGFYRNDSRVGASGGSAGSKSSGAGSVTGSSTSSSSGSGSSSSGSSSGSSGSGTSGSGSSGSGSSSSSSS